MEQLEEFSGLASKECEIEKITNSVAKKKFLNMPTMMNIVKRRVLKYIGKVVREEKEKAPHKSFLTAFCAIHPGRYRGNKNHPYKCTIENMDPRSKR
jgi:hypothetical protein